MHKDLPPIGGDHPLHLTGGHSRWCIPLNPIQLAGGSFHLQPLVMMQQPGCSDRGNRVEVERVEAERVGTDLGRAGGRKSARRPEAS